MQRITAAGWIRFGWLMGLVLGLSACGFHLRGSVQLPAVMERTHIEAGKLRELGQILEQQLQGAGGQLAKSAPEATATLKLLSEQRQRRVIAVSSSGQASAYELIYTVQFELRDAGGEPMLAPQTVSRSRDLNFEAGNVLGKSREEEQIYKALRKSVAAAILQRIQFALPGTAP